VENPNPLVMVILGKQIFSLMLAKIQKHKDGKITGQKVGIHLVVFSPDSPD
jgi:hypothetical protein